MSSPSPEEKDQSEDRPLNLERVIIRMRSRHSMQMDDVTTELCKWQALADEVLGENENLNKENMELRKLIDEHEEKDKVIPAILPATEEKPTDGE